jgi:DNA-binding protein H-NS
MAQTYSQLQAQIAKLQAAAETLRKSELAEVIAKIRVAISAYDITSEDLFGGRTKKFSASKPAPVSKSKTKSKGESISKFADEKGNSWVGRGPRPLWLRHELAAGKLLSEFAVNVSVSSPDVKPSPKKSATKAANKAVVRAGKKLVAAKYRDDAGNSWSGRGSQPRWLRDALTAGKTLEQLAV